MTTKVFFKKLLYYPVNDQDVNTFIYKVEGSVVNSQ